MKRGVRPVSHAADIAVLYRIEVDVIDVPAEVLGLADRVLSVTALPYAALRLTGATEG